MDEFEATGLTGILILLLTLGLVTAGIVCSVRRVPRFVATALLAATALPLLLGAAGRTLARAEMEEILATLKAPTVRDRAGGESESEFHLLIGLAATVLCYAATLPAFARSLRAGKKRS